MMQDFATILAQILVSDYKGAYAPLSLKRFIASNFRAILFLIGLSVFNRRKK